MYSISHQGVHLANKLEEFIDLTDDPETSDIKSKRDDLWRIVFGQQSHISRDVVGLSTERFIEDAKDWCLLIYCLTRVNQKIFSMTVKFLEQRSYMISNDEREELEAITSVYRAFEPISKKEDVELSSVLKNIKEPMLVIDDYYSMTLENIFGESDE